MMSIHDNLLDYAGRLIEAKNVEADVHVIPTNPPRWSEARHCHGNVVRQKAKHGGKHVSGWMLCHYHGIYSAVFHSVWQNRYGNLICITPLEHEPQAILFFPDANTQERLTKLMYFAFLEELVLGGERTLLAKEEQIEIRRLTANEYWSPDPAAADEIARLQRMEDEFVYKGSEFRHSDRLHEKAA
jgi:hypothetical protein